MVGFEFGIGDPYPHVAKQLRALGLTDVGDRSAKIEVQQMAWNFLRDRWAPAGPASGWPSVGEGCGGALGPLGRRSGVPLFMQ